MFRASNIVVRNAKNLANNEVRRCLSAAVAQPKPKVENKQERAVDRPNMSFMANIFRGELEASQVFPYPEVLTADQKETITMLLDPFERFFRDVNDPWKNEELNKLPESTENALWDTGAFGIQVSNDLGGMGLNNTQYGRMCEIVGFNDLGLGIVIGAHQSIGFKGIMLYGTEEQKKKYLPKVATEKVYAAFALTEPSSGSDAGSIRCRAVKSADGKHYVLNGSKIWISNGNIADIMTVFAQTEVEDPKTGQKKDKVTGFIVERGFGGVTSGQPEKKMGIRCSPTAEVYFEDVKIPVENVLGGEGNGFKVAMNILNNGRFGMSATLSGTMRYCIQKATEHAANRVQFGKKIHNFGAIQEKLARMSMHHYATESMAYTISQNMDRGSQDYHLEAAISKVFASESAWFVCDEAIQILGGMGYMTSAGLEKYMRDLRIFRIFEGTNDILRLFVALTGIQYAGSHLKELQRAFKNPAANLGLIFKESSRRAFRSVGIGGVDLSQHVHSELQDSGKKVAECIDAFGKAVESLLIKHGKNIVEQQFMLNNLANAAIDIYASVVVLSRASRAAKLNLPTVENELTLAKAWCSEATYRALLNLKKTESNDHVNLYKQMTKLSNTLIENDGVYTTRPID